MNRKYSVSPSSYVSRFNELENSLTQFGFTAFQRTKIYAIMAAIIHFGNIRFEESESFTVITGDSNKSLKIVANLLNIDLEHLRQVLLQRVLNIKHGESIRYVYSFNRNMSRNFINNKLQFFNAVYSWTRLRHRRHEIFSQKRFTTWCFSRSFIRWTKKSCRTLYHHHHIFKWLTLPVLVDMDRYDELWSTDFIVFIFTESLESKTNTYEHLCINYINEKFQNYFVERMIKDEELWYEKEGLDVPKIPFLDNAVVLGECIFSNLFK